MMHCPSCATPTELATFTNHLGANVEIDICWPCHLIWFDHMESTSLSVASVVELFRRINAHRKDNRAIVAMHTSCPICHHALQLTNDIGRSGKFSYHRCPDGHGRLISFTQFLREKNFIRSLSANEISALSLKVKQIRCSSCGAPVNIEHDTSCTHCGSPIAVLDEEAVHKALAAYDAKQRARAAAPPAAYEVPSRRSAKSGKNERDGIFSNSSDGDLTDLVMVGVGALLSAFLD